MHVIAATLSVAWLATSGISAQNGFELISQPGSRKSAQVAVSQAAENRFLAAFDQLWAEMDREYSYFELKNVDWTALRDTYRPQAESARSARELVAVLRAMLAELKDQHIWIDGPDGRVGTYLKPAQRNWSSAGIQSQLAHFEKVGNYVGVGRLKSGYGLVIMLNQGAATPELAEEAVRKIEALSDVPGFIVDLRNAEGGNEMLAVPIAACFCNRPTVYAKQKFRGGPAHTEFSPTYERTSLPSGRKPFTKPVVVLLGPRIMSSGEGMAMMFAALPNVTTVGAPTRGSSGGPKPFELKDVGITVTFSRWVAMLPDGTPIEGRGVIPVVEAVFPPSAFGARDPVLEKGIEVLQAKLSEKAPEP